MTAARLVTRLLTKCPILHLGTKGPTLGSLAEQARAWRVRQVQQRVRWAQRRVRWAQRRVPRRRVRRGRAGVVAGEAVAGEAARLQQQ
jgi:hypothetical protein